MGPGLLIVDVPLSHSDTSHSVGVPWTNDPDTSHSVGVPWTNDRPVAQPST